MAGKNRVAVGGAATAVRLTGRVVRLGGGLLRRRTLMLAAYRRGRGIDRSWWPRVWGRSQWQSAAPGMSLRPFSRKKPHIRGATVIELSD
jgi:hypothetical protein